ESSTAWGSTLVKKVRRIRARPCDFCVFAVRLLQHHAPHVAEKRDQVTVEARRGRAVDHAVIPGQRQRQDQPGVELLAVPYRSHARAAHAEDRDFGRSDDWREVRAADAAQARDREAAALHVRGAELAFARLGGELTHLFGDREHALLVRVLDDGYD